MLKLSNTEVLGEVLALLLLLISISTDAYSNYIVLLFANAWAFLEIKEEVGPEPVLFLKLTEELFDDSGVSALDLIHPAAHLDMHLLVSTHVVEVYAFYLQVNFAESLLMHLPQ